MSKSTNLCRRIRRTFDGILKTVALRDWIRWVIRGIQTWWSRYLFWLLSRFRFWNKRQHRIHPKSPAGSIPLRILV